MEREENNSSMLEAESASLDEPEEILGYKFKDKKLLEEAFTHKSYPNKSFSYERLEYVGDSVLGSFFAMEHFSMYPNEGSDTLIRLRSANVDNEKLARVAVKHRLHRFLRHNLPLLQKQIREFSQAIVDYPLQSYGQIYEPKVLADIVESAVGVIVMDSGNGLVDSVWKVVKNLLEPVITLETLKKHLKSELTEFCSKRHMTLTFEDEPGVSSKVFVDGKLAGEGFASNKDIARAKASRDALDKYIPAIILKS